jgi:hypothetical protein
MKFVCALSAASSKTRRQRSPDDPADLRPLNRPTIGGILFGLRLALLLRGREDAE